MCIRQASMFNDLRSRLISHGFTNIEYNIINMVKGIDKLHALEAVSPNIPVHQETHEDKTVETLGAGKDHFLILDSCNRLIYQVIMPWSFLFYPYVKAAILSAYNDKPCGDCDGHMTEEGYTTVTIIKHIPLLDIFKATFPEQTEHKKHSHIKKHGHHHHHHHHIHSHSHPHSHPHLHHHHHHAYPVYYNFEEKDGHKMTVDEQYDALKSFLSQHLHLLNINNDTFEVHSQANENDYKKFYNTESNFVNTATEHNSQSDIFGNTVVYTDELTKVPVGTDAIRVEQMEGNVQEGHHTVSKDEVLSQNSPPLQVTLWYPHYHVYNGQKLKDHYFIVLHSKDPKYHGHVVPDTSEDKGIGDTFAGEKEHQTGHHINTTHQFHEESHSHHEGSQTHVGVQTDESHLTSTTSLQGQDNAFGVNVIGGSGDEHKTDHGLTHTQEHSTHNTEQNFTSGGQNTFGHGYSYNTTHTETSETHHHSTFGTGHNENEIISDNKKTDTHGKDILGTTTGSGHESTGSHGSSHGTSVSTTVGHSSSQSDLQEIAGQTGQTGHSHTTATDSVDNNVDLHHENDKKVTQVHDTININKDTQHQGIHTVTNEGKDLNVIGSETHTDHSGSVVSQGHNSQNFEGTSTHTENTGFISSGSQNQIGGNQYGTNSQSESSAHGGSTNSESSSYSTSQGTYSFSSSSSSSSSSSGGSHPSVIHNVITEDNRDKIVSHEQSGGSQTNLHSHGGQTHHTSLSHGSGSMNSHATDGNSIQTSGNHEHSVHDVTSSGTEGHKIDSSGTGTSGFSSSGGSDSHSTSYTSGSHGTSGHTTQTQASGSDSTFEHSTGQITTGHDSGSHVTNHVTGTDSTTFGHNAGSQGSYHSYSHGSSQNSSYTHSASSHEHETGVHVEGSEKTSSIGHSSGTHGTHSTIGHSSGTHGTHSTVGHSSGTHGSHSTVGHSSGTHGSHSAVGHNSYSQHGGSSSHQAGTTTQGHVIESIHGGSSTSHGKGGHGKGEFDDRIIFRDNSHEEFDFHKFLEKQEKQEKDRRAKMHSRTMDEGDAEPEPIEKTKDGEELINHYSKILPWIEYPVD